MSDYKCQVLKTPDAFISVGLSNLKPDAVNAVACNYASALEYAKGDVSLVLKTRELAKVECSSLLVSPDVDRMTHYETLLSATTAAILEAKSLEERTDDPE